MRLPFRLVGPNFSGELQGLRSGVRSAGVRSTHKKSQALQLGLRVIFTLLCFYSFDASLLVWYRASDSYFCCSLSHLARASARCAEATVTR